jgi:hypothetical protein
MEGLKRLYIFLLVEKMLKALINIRAFSISA